MCAYVRETFPKCSLSYRYPPFLSYTQAIYRSIIITCNAFHVFFLCLLYRFKWDENIWIMLPLELVRPSHLRTIKIIFKISAHDNFQQDAKVNSLEGDLCIGRKNAL